MLGCHSDLHLTPSLWWWLVLNLRGVLRDFEMNRHQIHMLGVRPLQMPQPPRSICLAQSRTGHARWADLDLAAALVPYWVCLKVWELFDHCFNLLQCLSHNRRSRQT